MANEPHNSPSEVAAESGTVLVDGPDGVSLAMTPAAACETGKRLIEKGEEAAGQEATPQPPA